MHFFRIFLLTTGGGLWYNSSGCHELDDTDDLLVKILTIQHQKNNRACALFILFDFQNFLAQLAGLEHTANAYNVGISQKSFCDVVGFVACAGDDGKRLSLIIDADVSISNGSYHDYFLLNIFGFVIGKLFEE